MRRKSDPDNNAQVQLPDTHLRWADVWPTIVGIVGFVVVAWIVVAILFALADWG